MTPEINTETKTAQAGIHVVAMASSAGGLAAFSMILAGLSAHFPVPILLLMHLDPSHPSLLSGLLGRRTALQVREAEPDLLLRAGLVIVAPPDRHMRVGRDGAVHLGKGDRVHFSRPSADELFFSVAEVFGPRAV